MEHLPLYLSLLFGLIVAVTIIWFYAASGSKTFLVITTGWAVLQSVLGLSGLYKDTQSLPPRIMLFGVLPALLIIILCFLTTGGKAFIDRINLKTLTYFHTIRVPVEIVLVLLYYQGVMSVYITYEGTNFDLFSGITAPLVAYLAFRGGSPNKRLLLAWNILCLLLLLNVMITAIFSIESPFQKLAFDQPNKAVLYFPFNLLPTLVVPLVFLAHLTAIRRLTKRS